MNDIAAAAELLRTERARLGWTTREVAERIRGLSEAIGDPITLTQQAVSKFENGKAKSIPNWMSYFVNMVDLLEQPASYVHSFVDDLWSVNQRRRQLRRWRAQHPALALPASADPITQEALVQMFEGLLEAIGEKTERAEIARELAQLLPTALSRLQDQMIDVIGDASKTPKEVRAG